MIMKINIDFNDKKMKIDEQSFMLLSLKSNLQI